MTDEQREQLEDIERQQQELEEEILRLRELNDERDNQDASQALQRAQEASQQARESFKKQDPQEAQEQQERAEQELQRAADELEEERQRYEDLRQEELLFRLEEELVEFLETQRPITIATAEALADLENGGRLSRPERRRLNEAGETERELAAKTKFLREALEEDSALVFTHVLRSNEVDLNDVADRLVGRRPDVSPFTVQLQRDVEQRAERMLKSIQDERERMREERERQEQEGQQDQQNQQDQNGQQQERLVSAISELIMLRKLEEDLAERTRVLSDLYGAVGDEGLTEADASLAERLAHQHEELTTIFEKIKSQVQAFLGEQAAEPGADGESGQEGSGR
ncbi:MAG: hypothetical protein AAF196_13260 [Planctomycetota bacterium]